MRSTQFALVCLVLCIGCYRAEGPAPGEAPVPSPNDALTTGGSAEDIGQPEYPEKEKVLALVHRAQELKRKGQFQAALNLAEEALVVDPHSPTAIELRQELVDILVKVKDRRRGGVEERVAVSG